MIARRRSCVAGRLLLTSQKSFQNRKNKSVGRLKLRPNVVSLAQRFVVLTNPLFDLRLFQFSLFNHTYNTEEENGLEMLTRVESRFCGGEETKVQGKWLIRRALSADSVEVLFVLNCFVNWTPWTLKRLECKVKSENFQSINLIFADESVHQNPSWHAVYN